MLRNQAAQRFGGNAQQAAQLPRELFEADAKRVFKLVYYSLK